MENSGNKKYPDISHVDDPANPNFVPKVTVSNLNGQECLDRQDENYAEYANVLRNANKKDPLPPENLNSEDDKNSAKVQNKENYAKCAEVLRTAEKRPVPPENLSVQDEEKDETNVQELKLKLEELSVWKNLFRK